MCPSQNNNGLQSQSQNLSFCSIEFIENGDTNQKMLDQASKIYKQILPSLLQIIQSWYDSIGDPIQKSSLFCSLDHNFNFYRSSPMALVLQMQNSKLFPGKINLPKDFNANLNLQLSRDTPFLLKFIINEVISLLWDQSSDKLHNFLKRKNEDEENEENEDLDVESEEASEDEGFPEVQNENLGDFYDFLDSEDGLSSEFEDVAPQTSRNTTHNHRILIS